MPKRRILWFPVRGIDKTLPKSLESASSQQISDMVAYAADGSELASYNSRDLVTRRDLKAYSGTNYTTVYGLLKYQRGLAVAGSSGIYLDSSPKKSQTISGFTYMAPWYQSLYWSTGSAWGYVASDDTAYDLGIDAPDSGSTQQFADYYSDSGSNGSWDHDNSQLTAAGQNFETTVTAGDYIQVYDVDETTCFTGVVSSVDSDTELTVTVDPVETNPADDAGADIHYYISPHRWMTYRDYLAQGSYSVKNTGDAYAVEVPVVIKYKLRFKRSGDGARSNTTTQGSYITSGTYKDCHWCNTLVGGKSVASLDGDSDDSNVDYVELYRLDLSVTTTDLYRLIATLDIGTTTYTDEVEMTDALTALDDDEKYPCPYVLSNLTFFGSRLWGTYINRVYYSEAYGDEERFQYFGEAGLNYFEFPDTIKTICDYNRTLLVFLEREAWVLEGLNPNTMNKRRLNKDLGTYSATSATVYKGRAFTVTSDKRFYQISGADWSEMPQLTSLLPSSVSYIQVIGSDNCIWISTGSQVVRYELSNQDAWVYSLSGYLGSGSHTTYLGQSGKVYEVDSTGGSESTPAASIKSPSLYIGSTDGRRGKLNRILFRANCASGTITITVDGSTWKTMTFSTSGEETVVKHFWPVQGYYAEVEIASNQYNELTISGPVVLNPF